jgi:hypothetical protein
MAQVHTTHADEGYVSEVCHCSYNGWVVKKCGHKDAAGEKEQQKDERTCFLFDIKIMLTG